MTKREKIEIQTTEGTTTFRCPKLSEFETFVEASDLMERQGDIASIRAVRGIMQGWLLSGTIDLEPWEFNHVRNRLYVECFVPPEKKKQLAVAIAIRNASVCGKNHTECPTSLEPAYLPCPFCGKKGCDQCRNGEIEITQCPLKLIDTQTWQDLRLVELCKSFKAFPNSGGLMDQPVTFLNLYRFVESLVGDK